MPLNPLLVIKASMTICILHKNYWIRIFEAYVGNLTQSKLQSMMTLSPKERASKHWKIDQGQNQSSAPHHWASVYKSCSAPGTGSKGGKWYIPFTAVAGQSPARKHQLTHTRLIWTYLQSSRYIAILRQLRTQLRSNKCFHIYAILETLLRAAENAAASKYANTLPLLGKLQSDLGSWNGPQNPAAPKAW